MAISLASRILFKIRYDNLITTLTDNISNQTNNQPLRTQIISTHETVLGVESKVAGLYNNKY